MVWEIFGLDDPGQRAVDQSLDPLAGRKLAPLEAPAATDLMQYTG